MDPSPEMFQSWEMKGNFPAVSKLKALNGALKSVRLGGAVDDSRIEMECIRTAWREKDEKKKEETTER